MASTTPSPLISTIIPTRGRPELLLRALRSALAQTLRSQELIVVVDGPDPATLDALTALAAPQLQVVALDEPVGGAEARNVGARAARGEWIALLDDDDEWLPEKLEKQLDRAASQPGTNLVVCQHLHRAPGARDVVRPRRMPHPGEPVTDFMFEHLCYFQTSTFLCRRSLFLRVPFQKALRFFQDIDWFLRVNRDPETRLAIVDEPLTIYHEPRGRATVTTKTPWTARMDWGRQNRSLMSRRAYASFLVGSCAARAVEEGAGLRGFIVLGRECVLRGRPNLRHLLLLGGIFSLSPDRRRRLRDRFFLQSAGVQP